MDIIIREKKSQKNLYQIVVYNADLNEIHTVDGIYFESEELAEKYGKEKYNTDTYGFVRVIMENGKEIPSDGTILYGDANHPGEIYICPEELEQMLLDAMRENGQAPYKCKQRWFPKDYSFCMVSLAEEYEEGFIPLNFEWDDSGFEDCVTVDVGSYGIEDGYDKEDEEKHTEWVHFVDRYEWGKEKEQEDKEDVLFDIQDSMNGIKTRY